MLICYKFFFKTLSNKNLLSSAKVWKIWHIFYGGRHYSTPTNTYKSLHLHSARKKTLNFTTSQFPLKNGGLLFLQSLLSCTDLAPWLSNNVYQYCNTSCWKKVNQPATISRSQLRWNLDIINCVLSPTLFTNARCLLNLPQSGPALQGCTVHVPAPKAVSWVSPWGVP